MNNLSDRLQTIADLVIQGEAVADIGTDHGFIPIELLCADKVPFAILSDVNQGPIDIAKANLTENNISSDKYSVRLGDGLKTLDNNEVSTVIIAGMGGELIQNILDDDILKSHSYKRFILQPRTHANELRYYLSNNSFKFVDYKLVKEKFRICEIFVVEPTTSNLNPDTDLISRFLLEKKDPLILEFINQKIHSTETVLKSLESADSDEGKAQTQLFKEVLKDLFDAKESAL